MPTTTIDPEMSVPLETLVDEIREYSKVCDEVHSIVRRENQILKSNEPKGIYQFQQSRKDLLARLSTSQMRLSVHKAAWMRVAPTLRAKFPQIAITIRHTLDLIMKTILLDRENEQLLLRHQLVPTHQLPFAQRQNPHFVARLYSQSGRRAE